MREGGLTGANCTCCVWENFIETMRNISDWKADRRKRRSALPGLFHCRYSTGEAGRQNSNRSSFKMCPHLRIKLICPPLKSLASGLSKWRTTRNLIGSGCYETTDRGLSDFGREIVAEMNRVGIVRLSHVGTQLRRCHPCIDKTCLLFAYCPRRFEGTSKKQERRTDSNDC